MSPRNYIPCSHFMHTLPEFGTACRHENGVYLVQMVEKMSLNILPEVGLLSYRECCQNYLDQLDFELTFDIRMPFYGKLRDREV